MPWNHSVSGRHLPDCHGATLTFASIPEEMRAATALVLRKLLWCEFARSAKKYPGVLSIHSHDSASEHIFATWCFRARVSQEVSQQLRRFLLLTEQNGCLVTTGSP